MLSDWIESVRAWPWEIIGGAAAGFGTGAYVLVVMLSFFVCDWTLGRSVFWPVVAVWYLASYPLRRLGRWWRGRREAERKQRTAVEQFQDECRAEDMRDYYGWYFKQGGWGDAPEQPGKRADKNAGGGTGYVMARLDAEADIPPYLEDRPCEPPENLVIYREGESLRKWYVSQGLTPDGLHPDYDPSAMTGDGFRKVPYGSKPDESQKPVRREEYEDDIRAQDAVNESLEARVAALEGTAQAIKSVLDGQQQAKCGNPNVGYDWPESARAGEGVRAWTDVYNPGHTLLLAGNVMHRRRADGVWEPSWIEQWLCDKLPELPHAEALRLDAERRGQGC